MTKDEVIEHYQDAYKRANGKPIRVRKITTVRYILQGSITEFTAKQMRGFTKGLEDRSASREVI